MPSDFFYFLSSLPLLRFDEKIPLSYPDFLSYAQEKLSPEQSALLSRLSLCPAECPPADLPVVVGWEEWETSLRNVLVLLRRRGGRSAADKWQRKERGYFLDTRKRLEEILVLPNAWERERALDRLRWQKLDELQAGHFYNFSCVVIYAYRLLLLTRQSSWKDEEGGKVFAALLEQTAAEADARRINES